MEVYVRRDEPVNDDFKILSEDFLLGVMFADYKVISGSFGCLGSVDPGMFSRIGLVIAAKSVKMEVL